MGIIQLAKIAATSILCLISTIVLSQNRLLTGKIKDAKTSQPLRFATIQLSGRKSSSSITDSLGNFQISNILSGNYRLRISSEGYRSQELAIVFADTATIVQLPDISLIAQFRQLDSVTIRAPLYTLTPHVDGYFYRISADLPMAGERAPDILRRLPGLQVSPDGTPSINGSSRIKVFIDGKPSEFLAASVTDALSRIPAELVASVEVITHPSAKYEGEGVDGVILITTRRLQQNAASGTINAIMANRLLNGQANAMIRRNNLIGDADAGYNLSDMSTKSSLSRRDKTTGSVSGVDQAFTSDLLRRSYNAGAGITGLPDSLTSASLNYRYGWYHDHTTQEIASRVTTPQGLSSFNRNTTYIFDRFSHSLSGSVNRKSRNKLNDYTLLTNIYRQRLHNPFDALVSRPSVKDYVEKNNNRYYSTQIAFQADLAFSLPANTKLETGMRYVHSKYDNTNQLTYLNGLTGAYLIDAKRSSSFGYRTVQPAVYMSYAFALGKYKFRTGLRYEHTSMWLSVKDSAFEIPPYSNWLPNILISRSFLQKHTFTLSAARRLQRPYIVYLNPVTNYLDSFNIERGNPALQPVIIRNLTLTYNTRLKNIALNASFVLNSSKGNIEQVKRLLPGGIAENTWINISSNTSYGISGGANYQDKHWSINLNHTLSRLSFQTSIDMTARNAWMLQNSWVINYTFAKEWTVATYLTANTNTPTFQGSITGTRWYNLILIKKFKHNHFSAAMRLDNFFTRYQYITDEVNTSNFSQRREVRNIYRFFRIHLSWKLGRKEIYLPESRRRAIENG